MKTAVANNSSVVSDEDCNFSATMEQLHAINTGFRNDRLKEKKILLTKKQLFGSSNELADKRSYLQTFLEEQRVRMRSRLNGQRWGVNDIELPEFSDSDSDPTFVPGSHESSDSHLSEFPLLSNVRKRK